MKESANMMERAGQVRLISRLLRHWRAHGTVQTVQRVVETIRPLVVLRESHIWYALPLRAVETSPAPLPEGYALLVAQPEQLHLLAELPTVNPEEGARRLDQGNDLWIALNHRRQPSFSCWIFRHSAPVLAATGGRLTLPDGFVVLEDSVTAASARGRGLAPAAWSHIAASLHEEGQAHLLTKVETSNQASRRAVTKAGFSPFALVHYRRILMRPKVQIEPQQPELVDAGWLARALPARWGTDRDSRRHLSRRTEILTPEDQR